MLYYLFCTGIMIVCCKNWYLDNTETSAKIIQDACTKWQEQTRLLSYSDMLKILHRQYSRIWRACDFIGVLIQICAPKAK